MRRAVEGSAAPDPGAGWKPAPAVRMPAQAIVGAGMPFLPSRQPRFRWCTGASAVRQLHRRLSAYGFSRTTGYPAEHLAAWRDPCSLRRAPPKLRSGQVAIHESTGDDRQTPPVIRSRDNALLVRLRKLSVRSAHARWPSSARRGSIFAPRWRSETCGRQQLSCLSR